LGAANDLSTSRCNS